MADIFISYAREDRDWVSRLAGSLEAAGWSVWWDRRIPTGQLFRKVIDRELASARCVLVVWSRAALDSDFVIDEAGQGREREVLVPVLQEMVLPPLGFRGFQSANLSAWDGKPDDPDHQSLVQDVEGLIGMPAVSLKEPAPKPEGHGTRSPPEEVDEGGPPREPKLKVRRACARAPGAEASWSLKARAYSLIRDSYAHALEAFNDVTKHCIWNGSARHETFILP